MITPLGSVQRASIMDHYDDLDSFYREIWGEHVHHGLWRSGREKAELAVQDLVRYVAERIGVQHGDRVVDIGSGYGASARLLVHELGVQVTALTISPAQFAFACSIKPGAANQTYLLCDWLENSLPGAYFDQALAIESTEHMEDKARAFSEIFRVLCPGGCMAVCAWMACERTQPWEVRHLLEPICREGRLAGMGTELDYRTLMQAAGLEVLQVEDLTEMVKPTWRLCIGRVARRIVSDRRFRNYLLDARSRNRVFLRTMVRIWAAYELGAMKYLLFVARRPNRGRLTIHPALAADTKMPVSSKLQHPVTVQR